MQELSAEDTPSEDSRKEGRYLVAVAWGVLMGGLTFAAGPLAWLSANPVIAAGQSMMTMLLFPGLLCAAVVGSLIPAAAINALLQFGISWLLLTLFSWFRRKAKARH
jgi:hypothetical protein